MPVTSPKTAFTEGEQAAARATLSRMGVRAKFDSDAAYVVLAYLGQAIAHALLVTDGADRVWLRRAAAVHEAWTALPARPVDGPGLDPDHSVFACLGPPPGGNAPPAVCVSCGGAIAATPTGWRHLDVVDALAGDHDARAEVAL